MLLLVILCYPMRMCSSICMWNALLCLIMYIYHRQSGAHAVHIHHILAAQVGINVLLFKNGRTGKLLLVSNICSYLSFLDHLVYNLTT